MSSSSTRGTDKHRISAARDPRAVDDMRIGRGVRRLRHRRSWTQDDLAAHGGQSQDVVSRVERGRIDDMPLRRVRAIARALDAEVVVALRWRGGDLERLMDEGHATLVGRVAELLESSGWTSRTEVSYAVYGERGSIDLLAWHEATRTLLVVEVKTEVVSIEATLRKHDEKVRLARRVAADRFGWQARVTSRLLVLPDLSTQRRHVDRHDRVMTSAYPVRGAAMRSWLRRPTEAGEPVSGLMFVAPTHGARGRRGPVSRKRVRRAHSSLLQA
jgi:transcriptional regulator with XRE-family HTH domain